jgi:molecular chaperone DnaK (HSP70)
MSRTLAGDIGIMTSEGFMVLLPEGTRLPALYSDTFSTAADDQPTFQVAIGFRTPEGIEKLCDAVVGGLPPAPKAALRIILTLRIDTTECMVVKTTVTETGHVQEMGPFPLPAARGKRQGAQ